MIESTIAELRSQVATTAACRALGWPRATWYRHHRGTPPPPHSERQQQSQPRALTEAEQRRLLEALHAPEHVDEAPATVYAKLLD